MIIKSAVGFLRGELDLDFCSECRAIALVVRRGYQAGDLVVPMSFPTAECRHDGMENGLYLHFIWSKIRSISTMLGRIKSVWMEFVSSSSFDISIILGDLTES